jgi:outer membrane protein insertion porin family
VQEPKVIEHGSEGVSLLISVTEGTHNSFDGIVGYLPATTAGGTNTVTGLVNLQFGNILGTGRRLSTRWYRENQSNQEIELRYTEPWVADFPLQASGAIFQRQQDSSFVKQRVEGDVEVLLSDEVSIGAMFSQSSVVPTAGFGASVTPESRVTSFGATFRYDTRDRQANPREGVLYATDYIRGTKSLSAPFLIPASSEATTERYSFDIQFYHPVARNQVAAVELHGKSISVPTLDASDLFLVGGATTLRGYREGQFRGNRIAWVNLEYRFLTGGESSVFAFVDAGYIELSAERLVGLTASEFSAVGYGLGVRADSPLGVLGVSIAFGKGDAFGDGKLHVRLYNRF